MYERHWSFDQMIQIGTQRNPDVDRLKNSHGMDVIVHQMVGESGNVPTWNTTDTGGISLSNISFNLDPPNATLLRQSASCLPGRCTLVYRYTPEEIGLSSYSVTLRAAVSDDVGNPTERKLLLTAHRPGSALQPDPDHSPTLLTGSTAPPNGAVGVPVDQIIRIGFSEPVEANSANLILKEINGAVVEADYVTRSSGGQFVVEIRPRSNLKFKTTYQVEASGQIHDFDLPTPRPLSNPQSLTFTTLSLIVAGSAPLENAREGVLFDAQGKSYLLMANDAQGVALLNVSRPAEPREVARLPILLPPFGQTYGVAVSDSGFYLDRDGAPVYRIGAAVAYDTQLGTGVIRILALDDPPLGAEISPRVIGTGTLATDFSGVPKSVALIDKYAYVGTLLLGIQIVDIGQAIAPHAAGANILAGAIDTRAQNGTEAWPIDMKAIGTHLFALTRKLGNLTGELIAIDATAPQSARITDALPFSRPGKLAVAEGIVIGNPDGSQSAKDLAFISNGSQLQIIDITDITQMTYLSTLDFQERLGSLAVDPERKLLYIGQGIRTVQIVDLKEIRAPKAVGTLSVASPGALISRGSHLYIAGGISGLRIAQVTPGLIRYEDPGRNAVIGAATDGVTRLEVIVEGIEDATQPITLTLEDIKIPQRGGIGGWVEGPSRPASITVTPQSESGVIRARATYEVPETFVRFDGGEQEAQDKESAERAVRVTARQGEAILAEEPLILKRPPVLLVHGTWGNTGTWDLFEPILNEKSLFTILRADYSQGGYKGKAFSNVGSLEDNYLVMDLYVRLLKNEFKKRRLAVTKVDVVAHSLGGLVVRKYCAVLPEDCRNRIHKLITLDTPHLGTELANLLEDNRGSILVKLAKRVEPFFANPFDGPALTEQAVGSRVLRELEESNLPIPMHMVAGRTPDGLLGYGKGFKIMWEALSYFYNVVPDSSFPLTKVIVVPGEGFPSTITLPLTPVFKDTDLEHGRNDRFIALYSQRFMYYNDKASLIGDVDHITIHDNETPIAQTKQILESPTSETLFLLP